MFNLLALAVLLLQLAFTPGVALTRVGWAVFEVYVERTHF